MDIFNSPWLISMLAKSGKSPQDRLLNLFDILDDWLKAPHIDKTAVQTATDPLLITFCTEQAKSLRAKDPGLLAEHIVLIARSAAQQAIAQPGSNCLMHAKKVAGALITAQTEKNGITSRLAAFTPTRYGIAASLLLMAGAAGLWMPAFTHSQSATARTTQHSSPIEKTMIAAVYKQDKTLSAHDAARMYSKYEQMRQGTCQFPEVLLIPDKHKSIYLENVVGGKIPTDTADLVIANAYLEKVRCNFTPMLMASSK